MNSVKHTSAHSSHYDEEAATYDLFNEKNSKVINQTLESILKKHHVKTVLDLTCGTGSQVLWLTKRGYKVVGLDINAKMLNIAKSKAAQEQLNIDFIEGDMRTSKIGKFDAALTIFNAVGHLTKSDFLIAMRTIRDNLNDGGLYVFDIFDLDYLIKDDHICKLTIDWLKRSGNTTERVVQYSTIDAQGILGGETFSFMQKGADKVKLIRSSQTLQVYTAEQLKEMLVSSGFRVLEQCDVKGSKFVKGKTERILTVAQKI